MTTTSTLFLLYTLAFDAGGQPIRLRGFLAVAPGEARFVVGADVPFDEIGGSSPEAVTTQIDNPLGLTGVTLTDLAAEGRIYRRPAGPHAGETAVDLAVRATAVLPGLGLRLTGAMVLEDGDVRLVLVQLSADHPITMTEFLSQILGGVVRWAAMVTDQLAFRAGHLYWLEVPTGERENYTYDYPPAPDAASVTFRPGYRVEGTLRLFGRYDFVVSLVASNGETTMTTTTPNAIDVFDFVTLDQLELEFANASRGSYLRVRTTVSILRTPIQGKILAEYDTGRNVFAGRVTAELPGVRLPLHDHPVDVRLGVAFTWGRGGGGDSGFRITEISGLPDGALDMLDRFRYLLNPPFGSCGKIVEEWLGETLRARITPALDGNPTRQGPSTMRVPLKLAYALEVDGHSIVENSISFAAVFDIPGSLDELPRSIWLSLFDSVADIAQSVIAQPATYEALAFEAGRRGGASAFARFICRALEEALEEVAKALAQVAKTVVAETIAAAAELAGALVAVALLGVAAVVSFFEQIWDEIKSWFGGGDSKKEEARERVRAIRAQVEEAVNDVTRQIDEVCRRITASALRTTLDDAGQAATTVIWNVPDADRQDTGCLSCHLQYLSGEAGDPSGTLLLDVPDPTFPEVRPVDFGADVDYRMNARIQTAVTGITFIRPQVLARIDEAVDQLRGVGDREAGDFADYLASLRVRYDGYNRDGIRGDWVYATTDVPTWLTIGRSRVGFNTRLST
ncbi:hypothetical protein AB0C02_13260 [Micromonospora sp. NPDC048999]|uniref:hypothetical protein n=1 Tax=Micromonospora sp. NPDC048999 TaxID=3155391 RepID=UPI003409A9C8